MAETMPYEDIDIYGTWLRLHDPIAFDIGYNKWMQEIDSKRR